MRFTTASSACTPLTLAFHDCTLRLSCSSRTVDSFCAAVEKACLSQTNLLTETLPFFETVCKSTQNRKVIRLVRQLFSSTVHNNPTNLALSRVSLQSISQEDDAPTSILQKKFADPKMYKLHSYFYLGLHYDALNQPKESKRCMKMALKTCANSISGNNQDITYLLPVIHMTVRDWYDDDNFEDDELESEEELIEQLMMDGAVELSLNGLASNDVADAQEDKLTQTIRECIKHMRIVDLREELKKRKLKVGGSKKVLQDRLVDAILIDANAKE
jgi:hypothetical protein